MARKHKVSSRRGTTRKKTAAIRLPKRDPKGFAWTRERGGFTHCAHIQEPAGDGAMFVARVCQMRTRTKPSKPVFTVEGTIADYAGVTHLKHKVVSSRKQAFATAEDWMASWI